MPDGLATLCQKTVKKVTVSALFAMMWGGLLVIPVWAMDSDVDNERGFARRNACVYSDNSNDSDDDEFNSNEWNFFHDFCKYLCVPCLAVMTPNPNFY